MSGDLTPPLPSGSKVALTVLVVLVVLSPWPFGSVHLRTTQAIALVSLATALGAFLWDGWHRQLQLPPRAILWPLLGLWALGVFQLVPMPEGPHRWIAPGSAAVWYPDAPAAAAVLGPGPHPISLYPDATRRWLAFTTGVIALALAAAPALRDRRLLLRACTAVVGGAVLVAVYGFVARLAFGNKLYGIWSVPTVAPFGPFVSKNHFAGYVELAAVLAIGVATGVADEARHGPGWLSWIESHRSKWVVIGWGAALVLVLAVPVSLSRGGVISVCAGLLVFVVLRLWTRGPSRLSAADLALSLVLGLLATVTSVLVLPAEARSRVLTLTGITSDQSGSYRLGIWRDTLRLVASSPAVGSGFGAYADALPRFKTAAGQLRIDHAENDHLEFLAEGGSVASLLGTLGTLFLFVYGVKALYAEEHRPARALLASVLAGGVAVGIHSVFDFNLHIPSNALMLAFAAAVVAASTRLESALGKGLLLVGVSLLICLMTPWTESRLGSGPVVRAALSAATSLRRVGGDRDVVAQIQHRPAGPATWLTLAWLRSGAARSGAPALGVWAAHLDPTNAGIRAAVRQLPHD